jgi:hypothetical protein
MSYKLQKFPTLRGAAKKDGVAVKLSIYVWEEPFPNPGEINSYSDFAVRGSSQCSLAFAGTTLIEQMFTYCLNSVEV